MKRAALSVLVLGLTLLAATGLGRRADDPPRGPRA